jgi:hypothetical protein
LKVHAHEKGFYNTLGGLNGYVSGIFISSWYLPPKKRGETKTDAQRTFQNLYCFIFNYSKLILELKSTKEIKTVKDYLFHIAILVYPRVIQLDIYKYIKFTDNAMPSVSLGQLTTSTVFCFLYSTLVKVPK